VIKLKLFITIFLYSCFFTATAIESTPIFQYCVGSSFLPDNSSITYVSNLAGGSGQLWMKPLGNQWPKQLTNFDEHIYKSEWHS
jgi:hypothetical protein